MDEFGYIFMQELVMLILCIGAAWLLVSGVYMICRNKPDTSRIATEYECARALTEKYGLTWEYMHWSDGDRWYAVKDRNGVLFLCKWREMEKEILDYYGRLPEDFKVNYKGKVVLR